MLIIVFSENLNGMVAKGFTRVMLPGPSSLLVIQCLYPRLRKVKGVRYYEHYKITNLVRNLSILFHIKEHHLAACPLLSDDKRPGHYCCLNWRYRIYPWGCQNDLPRSDMYHLFYKFNLAMLKHTKICHKERYSECCNLEPWIKMSKSQRTRK